MISYKTGDILKEETEAIINTVNCVGVMGRGIALQFKNVYPDNFKEYKKACKRGEVVPGKMFIHKHSSLINPKYIINFPTKRHWKGKSNIKDIKEGLIVLRNEIQMLGIKSVAIPPLGCGLGGLSWCEVKGLINEILGGLEDVSLVIFEPNDGTKHIINNSKEVPRMTSGRAALIELMYFMQEAGEGLKLKFAKAPYGPYAENLRHVLNVLEGRFIEGYNGEDSPYCPIILLPGASCDAKEFLHKKNEVWQRFKRVSDLIDGFETSFGLELLATVHWLVAREGADEHNIIEAVYGWNDKKRKFTERQIILAYETLHTKGWLAFS